MYWYQLVISRFADFSGRSRRKEYWMFQLFHTIFGILAVFLDYLLSTQVYGTLGWVTIVYATVVFIPGFAVYVRRLHDVGKSAWMLLVALIPIIGAIWLFVLTLTEGDHGMNAYGHDPMEG